MLLIFLIFMSFNTVASAQSKVCVLSYERDKHPVNDLLSTTFLESKDTLLKTESTPMDIVKCIKNGAEEIMLIVHTSNTINSEKSDLVYFRRQQKSERTKNIERWREELELKLKENKAKFQELKWSYKRGIPYIRKKVPRGVNAFTWRGEIKKLRRERRKIEEEYKLFYKVIDHHMPLYNHGKFLSRFFEKLYDYMKSLDDKNMLKLKKIRFAGCDQAGVLRRYPKFNNLIKDFNIELDLAPKSKWFSFLMRKPVVDMMIPDWYQLSIRIEK